MFLCECVSVRLCVSVFLSVCVSMCEFVCLCVGVCVCECVCIYKFSVVLPVHCSVATPDSRQTPLQRFPLNADCTKQFQMKTINLKTCREFSV